MRRATGDWRLASGGAFALAAAILLSPVATLQSQGVRFERTGFRMTSIGERITLSGRVLDARRRPVATGRIKWRVADPTIASVSPQGVVVSRKTGNTRLWAISGEDSTSALIVVDQWAAKFDFAPALVRLDAVGAKVPVRISVRDAEGHLINDANRRVTTCRSLNERVAVLGATGEVTARGNGTTFVRCTDRGIADSVRVEVRQRPARVTIADKTGISSKIVGDSLRLRLNAADRSGDEIRDASATWASLNPTIVSVDPLSGVARMIGGGTARIVAQVGDISDTATIAVAPGFGQAIPANTDTIAAVDFTPRVPTLDIDPLIPKEGDQATVTVRARTAQGAEVNNPPVSLRSSDTAVFVVESGLRIRAKKQGSAYVVGRYQTAVDSALVTVRSLSAVAAVDTAAEAARVAEFKRPSYDVESLRNIARRRADSARTQMFRGSVVARGASGRFIALSAVGANSTYRFTDDVSGSEERSGLVYGGTGEIAPFRWLRLGGDFRLGTLTSSSTLGTDLSVTEASADLTLQAASWIGVRGSYVLRALKDDASWQGWSYPKGTVVIRLPFVGGQVTTVTGVSVMPGAVAKFESSLQQKADPFSLGGEAGIELHTGLLNAGILYAVEGFKFPDAGRTDQFSSIRLRLGLKRGR